MKWILGILAAVFLFSCNNINEGKEWKEKVKFDLKLMEAENESGELLGYAFCIPNEAMLVEQIRQIHPDLEVVDHPEKVCDTMHFFCRFHPVKPAHLSHLKKIAALSYVEEIHPVWKSSP